MADPDSVDNSALPTDNKQSDEVDVVRINMAEHEPLNDPNCEHKNIVKDDTEELGDAYYCKDCKLGWIYAPADSPS